MQEVTGSHRTFTVAIIFDSWYTIINNAMRQDKAVYYHEERKMMKILKKIWKNYEENQLKEVERRFNNYK